MSKRYLRLDIEYEFSGRSWITVKNNIQSILSEDMPYCTIIFSRDTLDKDDLDRPKSDHLVTSK